MKSIFLALAAVLVVCASAPASAQQQPKCTVIEGVKPADAGFKLVGVRRPKVDGVKAGDSIGIFVSQSPDLARKGDLVRVAETCGANLTFYRMQAVEAGNFHATEILLPETAKSVVIRSCSKAAGDKCWTGVFDGDFTKFVTLTEDKGERRASASTLKGQYKD